MHSFFSFFPLLLFLFYWITYKWMFYTEKKNYKKEAVILFYLLENIIDDDIKIFGNTIILLNQEYIRKEVDENTFEICIVVYLSNGVNIKYKINKEESLGSYHMLELITKCCYDN